MARGITSDLHTCWFCVLNELCGVTSTCVKLALISHTWQLIIKLI